ncbi:hypothetical protein PN462_04200 [Spirulina sp. CS-785/01]|uniref:(2Fe-2S) ferredoxin domain-containing protein n=1 Tax=Spirulina sp. CS-785/01 TaxID=3021716 RepID=UPI00233109FF|nr:hypothetical protein [Spirulina sp. CS-785/01]MDB9312295.1 hypothetical protein [Spirulina sp. CS-785/01]
MTNKTTETTLTGGTIEYEDFSCEIGVLGPMLYTLCQDHWQEVQIGHVVQGSVLELSFLEPPKIFVLYDGYLTVATEAWHLHLCVEEHLGGPHCKTPPELRKQRLVTRGALYRRLNRQGKPTSWGIQFWNGDGEKMMTFFLPNPYLGEDEDLLPEGKPQWKKLGLYETLREIYVLGNQPIPFPENPLKRPYLAVCRSSRCNPSRNWQPTYDALKAATEEAGLDIPVQTAGCLEVCQQGPVVFYSGDRSWYVQAKPELAKRIVNEHIIAETPISEYLYPQNSNQ